MCVCVLIPLGPMPSDGRPLVEYSAIKIYLSKERFYWCHAMPLACPHFSHNFSGVNPTRCHWHARLVPSNFNGRPYKTAETAPFSVRLPGLSFLFFCSPSGY